MKTQILSLTEAFPPAHKLTETLMNIEYKKHLNSFLDAVEFFCAFVAAIATVLYDKWMQHNMTERVQLWSLNVYTWTKETAVPNVKNAALVTYNAGVNVRCFYNAIRLPLMMTY